MSLEIAAARSGLACNDLKSLTGLCDVEARAIKTRVNRQN